MPHWRGVGCAWREEAPWIETHNPTTPGFLLFLQHTICCLLGKAYRASLVGLPLFWLE